MGTVAVQAGTPVFRVSHRMSFDRLIEGARAAGAVLRGEDGVEKFHILDDLPAGSGNPHFYTHSSLRGLWSSRMS